VRKSPGVPGIDDREFHKTAPVPRTGRPSIYDLREPEVDLGAFLDEHAPLPRDARVLDAGCGPGAYVPAVRTRVRELVALDIAHNRLLPIDGARRVAGDVQALPFRDAVFDAALAMHMLYHVPDIAAGVAELRRVVRDGGVLYAFTNSEHAQHELHDLFVRAGGGDSMQLGDARFSNESGGAVLRTAFDDVTLVELTDSRLVVRDAACVVDELQRLRYTLDIGTRVPWDELIVNARNDAQAIIDRDGAFVMTENHGLFTCR
jgi:SAM-dependent methyltransferase